MTPSFLTTTRNALRYMIGTDLISDIDAGFQALAEDVDTRMASYSQDTLAKRPAAGRPNAFFKATDKNAIWHDTGSAFEPIAPNLVIRAAGGTITAANGDLCEGTGTVNLPAPAVNTVVGLWSGGTLAAVAANGGSFVGTGYAGQTSITLGLYQGATLIADGTNWLVVGGDPYRGAYSGRQTYAINTSFSCSQYRACQLSVDVQSPHQAPIIEAKLIIGGVEVQKVSIVGEEATRWFTLSGIVQPGEQFQVAATGAWSAAAAYRAL